VRRLKLDAGVQARVFPAVLRASIAAKKTFACHECRVPGGRGEVRTRRAVESMEERVDFSTPNDRQVMGLKGIYFFRQLIADFSALLLLIII